MLQWMGGSRRKVKATREAKLKRQREFFDHGKAEKRRRNEFRKESGQMRTLADYFRQNMHGGESLDILGLRSLKTQAVVDTEAKSDAILPDPAIAALRPKSGESGGVTVPTSNVSDGPLRGNNQNISPCQPECTTNSRRIIQEQTQERDAFAQLKAGAADTTQQESKKLVNGNTGLPLPGKAKNPVYVGNLQTKKVAPTPRLNLLHTIISDIKGDSRGKKRSPLEDCVVFSQDEINVINRSIFDQHPQQTLIQSERSVPNWGDTRQLLPSSLELNNSYDCHPDTSVTGASDIWSRFLSTQKLKNFKGVSSHQHESQPKEHNMTGKNPLTETKSLLNPFRAIHNECNNPGFFNATFNMMDEQGKNPREGNSSEALIDVENFHGKQEPKGFDISDPFVNITSHYVEQEHQESGFSDPFAMTENHKVKQERLEYENMNPSFNTSDYQVTQGLPFLTDLSYDQGASKVDMNIFNQKKGFSSPDNDPVTWDFDPQRNSLPGPPYFKSGFKREFSALDNFRSVQVRSCDESPGNGYRQFGTCDSIPDMTGITFSHLENMETAFVNFGELPLPLDGFEVERQDTEAAFSPLGDYSQRQIKINQSNFENGPPVWDDVFYKKCTFSVQWNCESSVGWDVPRCQENCDPANAGGNLCRTHNRHDNSWMQTAAGGTAGHFTDHLTGEMNMMQCSSPRDDVMRGMNLSSATHATIAPEILWDPEPLFLPQVNNGEDFTFVCYPDNEDSPRVETNTVHLPIQSFHIPLPVFGTLESPSRIEHDINVLSPGTPSNRFSQEIYDSRESGEVVTAARATTTTDNNLLLEREDSACDMILNSHQFRKEYLLPLKKEVPSRQGDEPHRESYSELRLPEIRRLSSNLLTIERGNIEDGLEHHSSNSDKADQSFSSNVLYNLCDDHGIQHEVMHITEENSLEVRTPLKEALQEDMNGMSTTKAEDMLQKRSRAENAHGDGCEASFSSQEECSPAFQLTTVQAVLCKLQRPVCPCGSKPGIPLEHGIKAVGAVLLKLQRPTRPCCHGLGHQDAVGNETLQKNIKQKNMDQLSGLELEFKPTAECELRPLTHLSMSGSRGSLPLSNADKGCVKPSEASKPISRSSKEDEEKRGLSDISEQRDEKVRLSLDDIDAIASSSHQVSIQPYQKEIGSKPHSLRSELRIKKVPKSSVSTGGSVQYPTSDTQRNQFLSAPEEEQRSTRITEPPAIDAGQDQCAPANSQRNPNLVVPDQEQPHLKESDPPAPTTGVLEVPSDAPERQKGIEATQEKQALNDTQHNLPSTESFQQDGGSTTTYDPAYVKMLESYVVQLKFENNALRLSTGS